MIKFRVGKVVILITKNFAHRGFSARYPENTMLAFEKALDTGCDGIELDIHLTKDGRMVVIHDEAVDRTTDGHGYIKDMTLAQVRQLDAGSGQRIPTLEEYFDLVEKLPIITNVELKNGVFWYEDMEGMVIQEVRRRGLEDRIIFSSFNHFSMLKCKRLAPEIPCGFLTYNWIIEVGAYTKKHGVESVHPDFYSLTRDAVAEIHDHGVAINTYTVNTREDMERMLAYHVAGIISDDPALLADVLQEKAPSFPG